MSARLAVVILAAGESRRMGRPKALIPFPEVISFTTAQGKRPAMQAAGRASPAPAKAETFPERAGSAEPARAQTPHLKDAATAAETASKTFLGHLIEVTRHPRAGILRVVVGAHANEIRAAAKLDADELIFNEEWQRGQLSSLQAAIRSLRPGSADGMLVCLVDHPLISAELVARVMEAFERDKNKIVIPTYQGRRGHPVIFPSALYQELLTAPEEIGARAVVRAHARDVLEIPVEEEGVILNLNDAESLRQKTRQK
ncbi:MAG TPA: nucleotidyltransferase family protein [Candidatus Acidoferrales bacterium]|nr:nucleotidyltransferase family protein [Candidatus Acidoferrales bacterium]